MFPWFCYFYSLTQKIKYNHWFTFVQFAAIQNNANFEVRMLKKKVGKKYFVIMHNILQFFSCTASYANSYITDFDENYKADAFPQLCEGSGRRMRRKWKIKYTHSHWIGRKLG